MFKISDGYRLWNHMKYDAIYLQKLDPYAALNFSGFPEELRAQAEYDEEMADLGEKCNR